MQYRLATMFVPDALCDPVQQKSSGIEIPRQPHRKSQGLAFPHSRHHGGGRGSFSAPDVIQRATARAASVCMASKASAALPGNGCRTASRPPFWNLRNGRPQNKYERDNDVPAPGCDQKRHMLMGPITRGVMVPRGADKIAGRRRVPSTAGWVPFRAERVPQKNRPDATERGI
jgi:hypothetical protein